MPAGRLGSQPRDGTPLWLRAERLIQVPEDVLDVLGADAEADEIGADASGGLLFGRELAVGGCGGVDGEGACVADVGEVAEEVEAFDESLASRGTALDAESEDGAWSLWKIAFGSEMVWVGFEAWVFDPADLGVFFEKFRDGLGVLDVTIHAEGEGFDSLKGLPAVERGLAGADVAQDVDAGLDGEGGQSGVFEGGVDEAVVAWVRFGKAWEAAGGVVEVTAVDDDAADAGAVAGDEFGGTVGNDVSAPFDGPEEVGGGEGVIEHQNQSVFFRDGSDLFDGEDADVWVSEGLAVEDFGVGLNGALEVGGVGGIDEGDGDAEFWEGVFELAVGAAVEAAAGDDVIAGVAEGEDGLSLCGVSAAGGESCHAAFEVGYALFEHIGGRVHQARVDVAQLLQGEQVRGVFCALKLVTGGLVNRHGPAASGGIRGIAGMQLAR